MKAELQKKLLEKYPEFFEYIQKDKIKVGEKPSLEMAELLSQKEIVLPIQFGFECGDGWYVLLDELMSTIQQYIKNYNKWTAPEEPMSFSISQIKEKFGGLRVYGYGGDSQIDGMIHLAENLSYRICETCGTTEGVGQTDGWIYTICWDCLQQNPKAVDLKWHLNEK